MGGVDHAERRGHTEKKESASPPHPIYRWIVASRINQGGENQKLKKFKITIIYQKNFHACHREIKRNQTRQMSDAILKLSIPKFLRAKKKNS